MHAFRALTAVNSFLLKRCRRSAQPSQNRRIDQGGSFLRRCRPDFEEMFIRAFRHLRPVGIAAPACALIEGQDFAFVVFAIFLRFVNSTDTSTRAFSILACAHSTGRRAATPRSIPVSQHEKFASYLVPFSFENGIIRSCA